MFCSNCGEKLVEGDKYCSKCGNRVTFLQDKEQKQASKQIEASKPAVKSPKGEGSKTKLKKRFKDKFIDYDDTRLTEVMKGYCIQALFFYISGEPFCEDNKCRLYNAHWQEEVINAQLAKPEFCKKHKMLINNIRNGRLKINH